MATQATESLRDQLADLANKMSAQVPESVQQIMREADERLADSPLVNASLKVGGTELSASKRDGADRQKC